MALYQPFFCMLDNCGGVCAEEVIELQLNTGQEEVPFGECFSADEIETILKHELKQSIWLRSQEQNLGRKKLTQKFV